MPTSSMMTSRMFGGAGAAIATWETIARAIASIGRTAEAIRLLRSMLLRSMVFSLLGSWLG